MIFVNAQFVDKYRKVQVKTYYTIRADVFLSSMIAYK